MAAVLFLCDCAFIRSIIVEEYSIIYKYTKMLLECKMLQIMVK